MLADAQHLSDFESVCLEVLLYACENKWDMARLVWIDRCQLAIHPSRGLLATMNTVFFRLFLEVSGQQTPVPNTRMFHLRPQAIISACPNAAVCGRNSNKQRSVGLLDSLSVTYVLASPTFSNLRNFSCNFIIYFCNSSAAVPFNVAVSAQLRYPYEAASRKSRNRGDALRDAIQLFLLGEGKEDCNAKLPAGSVGSKSSGSRNALDDDNIQGT